MREATENLEETYRFDRHAEAMQAIRDKDAEALRAPSFPTFRMGRAISDASGSPAHEGDGVDILTINGDYRPLSEKLLRGDRASV